MVSCRFCHAVKGSQIARFYEYKIQYRTTHGATMAQVYLCEICKNLIEQVAEQLKEV